MLNDKQVAFCLAYVKNGLNAKRAYESAYGEKRGDSAQSAGSRLLQHVEVSNRIQKVYRERTRRSEVRAEDVIQGIAQVAFSDPRRLLNDDGTLKNLADLDDDAAAALASFEMSTNADGTASMKKIRTWDKTKALETLAKHLGLVGPEKHLHTHAVVHFTPDQMAMMSDRQLGKVESAYELLAEVEHDLGKKSGR